MQNMATDKKTEQAMQALSGVRIVLVEPKYAENIGSVARIAHNMGITALFVVSRSEPEPVAMARTATHHAKSVLADMQVVESLAVAVADCSWVVGTTARQGRGRFYLENPKRMVKNLLPKLAENKVALVFGPEDRGLSNDDLSYCNSGVTIPTADFASVNVAQAVGMICYELFSGVTDVSADAAVSPQIVPSEMLKNLHREVAGVLGEIGYLKDAEINHWMHQFTHFTNRIGLRAREVKVIRGICKQVQWLAAGRPREIKKGSIPYNRD
jgi:tRNA/rRNA methyltransferase